MSWHDDGGGGETGIGSVGPACAVGHGNSSPSAPQQNERRGGVPGDVLAVVPLPNEPCPQTSLDWQDLSYVKKELSKIIVHSEPLTELTLYCLAVSSARAPRRSLPFSSFPSHIPRARNRLAEQSTRTPFGTSTLYKDTFIASTASFPPLFSSETCSPILSALGGSLDSVDGVGQRQAYRGRTTHNLGLLSILHHLPRKKALVTQDTSSQNYFANLNINISCNAILGWLRTSPTNATQCHAKVLLRFFAFDNGM